MGHDVLPRQDMGKPTGGSDGDDGGNAVATNTASSTATRVQPKPAEPTQSVIMFNDFPESDLSNYNSNDHVFSIDLEAEQNDVIYNFKWTAENSSVVVQEVSWLGQTDKSTTYSDIASGDFSDDDEPSSAEPDWPFTGLTNLTAQLDFKGFDNEERRPFLTNPMAIRVSWKTDYTKGYSQSGLFSVMDTNDDTTTATEIGDKLRSADDFSGTETSDQSPAATTSLASATISAPSTGDADDNGDSSNGAGSSDDSSSGGDGGGGLSTGAIAGIAVGAALGGILIIGALIWFCLRRRRRNKTRAGYSPQDNSKTYMVDKETTSPTHGANYVDEGVEHHAAPPVSGTEDHQHGQPMLATYDTPDQHHDAPRGGSGAEQHGVSHHLVEEGMTAEEIQRLEDEERQLDAEIERAGRR